MEDKKSAAAGHAMPGHPSGCMCGMCSMQGTIWGYHRFMLIRWVLGLIILAMVFFLGMKIGEFKGAYSNESFGGYGRHDMMLYKSMPAQLDYQGGTMMYESGTTTAAPKAGVSGSTKAITNTVTNSQK